MPIDKVFTWIYKIYSKEISWVYLHFYIFYVCLDIYSKKLHLISIILVPE